MAYVQVRICLRKCDPKILKDFHVNQPVQTQKPDLMLIKKKRNCHIIFVHTDVIIYRLKELEGTWPHMKMFGLFILNLMRLFSQHRISDSFLTFSAQGSLVQDNLKQWLGLFVFLTAS